MSRINTRKIALNGLLSACTVLILFFATTLPTSRLSLYILSSFLVSIVMIESGCAAGWLFYISSGLISLFILQNKLGVVPYISFFGIYGIIKYYIEKLNKRYLEYVLKLLYFNTVLIIAYYAAKEFLLEGTELGVPLPLVAILLEIIFIVYDYVYSLFIGYYNSRLRKFVR